MEAEDKREIHPPGHETHSAHICHKCGWTFPNPHPSAKHRRAHKKVCGKIDGLQLIYHEDKAHSNEDVSDDNLDPSGHNENSSSIVEAQGVQRSKKEILYLNRLLFDWVEPVVGGLSDKGGEVRGVNRIKDNVLSESVAEVMNAGSSRVAEVTATSDLENSTSESTDILQSSGLTQDSQIRNPFERKTVNLDSGTHVQGHALPSVDVVGQSVSDMNAGSLVLEPGDKASFVEFVIPAYDYAVHTNIDTGEVVECSVTEVGPNSDEEGGENNTRGESPPTVCVLPDTSTSDSSEIDSRLHKMGEITELGVPSNLLNASIENEVVASSKDMVVDFKEPESTIYHAPEEQTDTSGGQNPQNEAIPAIHLATTETEGDEYQGGFVATAKVTGGAPVDSKQEVNLENQGDVVRGCDQRSKLERNPPAFSTSEHVQVQNASETKAEFCEDNELASQEVSLASAVAEEKGSVDVHLNNAVQEEANSGHRLDELIKMEDIFTLSEQVQEDGIKGDGAGSKTTQEEFIVDQNGLDGDHIDEGTQFLGLASGECAVEGFSWDEPEVHPGTSNRESILSKATGLVNTVVGSSKLDATGNSLEENKLDCSFGVEPYHGISHEILPETLVADAAGGSTSGSGVGSVVCKETAMVVGGCDVSHKESTDDHREKAKARHSPSSKEREEQARRNDTDNGSSGNLHQELKSNQVSVVGLNQPDVQNPTSEGHESSSFLSLGNYSSRDSAQGHASEGHYHSVQEEGDDNILKHNSNASVLPMDASVDSVSQNDRIEGCWGSVSGVKYATVPSTGDGTEAPTLLSAEAAPNISSQTSMASSDAILKKGSTSKEHRADSTELFEAPSFMTLVEPVKDANRQRASPELHSSQKPQSPNSPSQAGWFPSLANVVNDSQGRKKNKEIIAKVVNWSSGTTRTSLSRLLIEANLESRYKSLIAQERAALITREGEVSKDIRPLGQTTTKNSTAKGVTNKEYNSPQARSPITKRKRRKIWVPFMCCSSIN